MFLVDLFLERLIELRESIGAFNALLIVFFSFTIIFIFICWCYKNKSSETNETEEH